MSEETNRDTFSRNAARMETSTKRLRFIAFLLTALMLFQSCVVYRQTPTTLAKASQEQIKTKIASSNGAISKFDYITYEDGQFYGVNKDFDERGKLVKTPLREQEITNVLTKDKTTSTVLTVGVIVVPVIGITLLIGLASAGPGNPWGSSI